MSASIWRGKQATVRMEKKRRLVMTIRRTKRALIMLRSGRATSGARRALKMVMRMKQRVKKMRSKMMTLTKQTLMRRGKILMMGIKI